MRIEQLALCIGLEQRMVGMLAMDVGEELRRRLQLAQRRRRAVDIGARLARAVDDATQQAFVIGVIVLRATRRPAASLAATAKSALISARSAPARTTAASPRSPRASDSASMRMDLPAPVSPVSVPKPEVELELELVDNDEVAQDQALQHVSVRRRLRARSITWRGAPVELFAQHFKIAVALAGAAASPHVRRTTNDAS